MPHIHTFIFTIKSLHQKSVSSVYVRFQKLSIDLSVVVLCKSQAEMSLQYCALWKSSTLFRVNEHQISTPFVTYMCALPMPIFLHKRFLSCAAIALLCAVRRAAVGMGKGDKSLSYYVACPTHSAYLLFCNFNLSKEPPVPYAKSCSKAMCIDVVPYFAPLHNVLFVQSYTPEVNNAL